MINYKLAFQLLIIYQAWCGERVTTEERANSIVEELVEVLTTSITKKEAAVAFKERDWCATMIHAKELVTATWPLRDAVHDSIVLAKTYG